MMMRRSMIGTSTPLYRAKETNPMSAHVTIKAVESKIAKLGGKFTTNEHNRIRTARIGDAVVEYIAQAEIAECLSVRRCSDHHESQSDYHAGSFCNSIADAIRYVTYINTGRYA
jgi:hypothetical protein